MSEEKKKFFCDYCGKVKEVDRYICGNPDFTRLFCLDCAGKLGLKPICKKRNKIFRLIDEEF